MWAPFNLVDGAWLQRILNTGPCNEVQANLFAIWVDEAGNGKTELNHCNVYDTLLRSVNIYLPPITSHEFIELCLTEVGRQNRQAVTISLMRARPSLVLDLPIR